MPEKYRVTAPDGKVLILTGPPGASPDEVMARAKAMYKPGGMDDPRIPSGIGPEQMTDATGVPKAPLKPMDAKDFLGLAGLPRDLSQLKQAFTPEAMAKTLIPGYNAKNSLQGFADIPSNLMSGEPHKIMQGLSSTVQAVPLAGAIGDATKGAFKGLRNTEMANEIGDRLIQSRVPIDMKAENLGTDPIASLRQLPQANSLKGMIANVDDAIGTPVSGAEGELMNAIKRRQALAAELPEKYQAGIDVEPALRESFDPIIAEASRLQPGMADTFRDFLNRQINHIKEKYGSTNLDAGQILMEKRNFGDRVNFGSDSASVTLNEAKQNYYRALDKTFDHLLPEAAEVNKFYSGLLDGRRLLEKELRRTKNAPAIPNTLWGTAKSMFPETRLKTMANALLTNKNIPTAGGSALPFYQRPFPGQFDNPSGVAPPSIANTVELPSAPDYMANTPHTQAMIEALKKYGKKRK